MSKFVLEKIYKVSYLIEFLISALLAVTIIILTVRMGFHVCSIAIHNDAEEVLNEVLSGTMSLAVGVEFIKMLCKHTPNTIIETLMFAIARGMIVAHSSAIENLIGVLCIAGLFATKKFLFCTFSEVAKITLRGNMTVHMTNVIARVHIPGEGSKLLRDFVADKLSEEEKSIAIGSCVYYSDFALSISNIRDEKITRVDVLKSI